MNNSSLYLRRTKKETISVCVCVCTCNLVLLFNDLTQWARTELG